MNEAQLTNPTPATPATPPPAAEMPANSMEDFTEVQGGAPEAPKVEAPPADSYARRVFKDPDAVYKGYDELYNLYNTSLGETKNTVRKLSEAMATLPEALAQKLAAVLTQPQAPTESKEVPKPPVDQFSGLRLSNEAMLDPEVMSKELNAHLAAISSRPQPELNPDKIAETLLPKFEQAIERRLNEREQQRMQAQAEFEIKSLVDGGADPELVKTAVVYGSLNGKNSVNDAWMLFQNKFPVLFAKQKAEDIVGRAINERQTLPRDLAGTTPAAQEVNGLRSDFQKVVNYKHASSEFL